MCSLILKHTPNGRPKKWAIEMNYRQFLPFFLPFILTNSNKVQQPKKRHNQPCCALFIFHWTQKENKHLRLKITQTFLINYLIYAGFVHSFLLFKVWLFVFFPFSILYFSLTANSYLLITLLTIYRYNESKFSSMPGR